MNYHQSVSFTITSILGGVFALGLAFNAHAKDNECWADFFEGVQYKGQHFLVEGPAELAYLNKENGENWESRISSLKVGPKATVTVYENRYFKLLPSEKPMPPEMVKAWGLNEQDIKEDSELIFNANATIHNLSDFNFAQKIKSLKINCTN